MVRLVWIAVLVTACAGAGARENPPAPASEEVAMKTALSPDGQAHPGEILHQDRVAGRTWTAQAADVPASIAWVKVERRYEPVVRIEITGTPEQRRITKFGTDGRLLESTVQAPRPAPRPVEPPPPEAPRPGPKR